MFVDGLNRYAYCGNDPVNFIDPYGLWGENWGTQVANSGVTGGVILGNIVNIVVAVGNVATDSVQQTARDPTGAVRVIEGIAGGVQSGIAAENNNAARGGYQTSTGGYALSIAAELVGANGVATGASGYHASQDRTVSGWEQFEIGASGAANMIGTGAGAAAGGLTALGRTGAQVGTQLVDSIPPVPAKRVHMNSLDYDGPTFVYDIIDVNRKRTFKIGESGRYETIDGIPIRVREQLRQIRRDYPGGRFEHRIAGEFDGKRAAREFETTRIQDFYDDHGCLPDGNKGFH
jgi:hypothetical protein